MYNNINNEILASSFNCVLLCIADIVAAAAVGAIRLDKNFKHLIIDNV
jgi:hypothetical protein